MRTTSKLQHIPARQKQLQWKLCQKLPIAAVPAKTGPVWSALMSNRFPLPGTYCSWPVRIFNFKLLGIFFNLKQLKRWFWDLQLIARVSQYGKALHLLYVDWFMHVLFCWNTLVQRHRLLSLCCICVFLICGSWGEMHLDNITKHKFPNAVNSLIPSIYTRRFQSVQQVFNCIMLLS